MNKVQETIDQLCIQWLLDEPFWGQLLMQIPIKISLKVPSLKIVVGPDYSMQFQINPDWWESSSDEQKQTTIKNELMQLIQNFTNDDPISGPSPQNEILNAHVLGLIRPLLDGNKTTVPDSLIRELDILNSRRSEVDWRQALQLFGASSRKTRIKTSLHHVSKRYGRTPGIKIKRQNHLAIAIDTSGSVDAQKLRLFMKAINRIWRMGASITLIECDHKIRQVVPFRGQVIEKVKGGHGTNYNPVLKWASQQYPLDGIIYFTDGEGPIPIEQIHVPVLWALTEPLAAFKQSKFPGKQLIIKN